MVCIAARSLNAWGWQVELIEQHARRTAAGLGAAAAPPSHPQVSPLRLQTGALLIVVWGAGHVAPIEPVGLPLRCW